MTEESINKLPGKSATTKSRSPRKRTAAKKIPEPPPPKIRRFPWRGLALIGGESLSLVAACLVAIIAVLGRAAAWFGGTGLAQHLLPFAATVLVLALLGALLLWLWFLARAWLLGKKTWLPAAVAAAIAVIAGLSATGEPFRRELHHLRGLVGGSEEAERVAIAHQVFAAYRRSDLTRLRRILERVPPYLPAIRAAAEANAVDGEILIGIAATESSFLPRDSKDGGRGLFQITLPPKAAVEAVKKQLDTSKPDPLNHSHNAHLAAATLSHYLGDMRGDLFLGLLAYNMGPRNGGLRSIMNQYGARDFVTIQPYLKDLPRDYPIRVLTSALAYRLWRSEGRLPRYEEGDNALHIQSVGIPGLGDEFAELLPHASAATN